ncbi:MAG: spermidine/putrescine ABC transporter substrate-binding protein [Verrucomicrobiota bacterium]
MKLLPLLTALLCSVSSALSAPTLHLFTWADYINPDLVTRFEEANDCKVVIDTFDSAESMYAKLKAGADGYDLVFPTSYMQKVMQAEGMLLKLDPAKVPNIKNIDPAFLKRLPDATMETAVPYMVSYNVIAVRADKLPNVKPSWASFARTDLKKRVTLLDDMRETLGAGLKSLGYSLNTRDEKELAAARDVVIGWKKHIAKFDNEGYKSGIDSGEFHLVQGYSGDLWQVTQENSKVKILVPIEGTSIACDEMAILKGSKQAALAHQMIDFLCDPAIAAENMQWTGYYSPNPAALKLVEPDFLKNPAVSLPPDIQAKCELIEDLGTDLAKYTKVWDEIKAAK